MARALSSLAVLVALLGLVYSPNTVHAGIYQREAHQLEARTYPGWNSTPPLPPPTEPLPPPPPPGTDTATPTDGGGGGTPVPTPGTDLPSGGDDTSVPTGTDTGGGGGGGGTTDTSIIPPTETTTADTITDTATAPPSTETPPGGDTATVPSFTQSISPTPTPGSTSANVTVPIDADGIFYLNGTWTNQTSCDSNTKKTTDTGGTMNCSFVGTAIYMSTVVGPDAGIFTATIDGETVLVDAYRNTTENTCDVSWSRWGLQNATHFVSVVYRGASTEADPTQAPNSSLEITRFVVTAENPPAAQGGDQGGASSGAIPAYISAWGLFVAVAVPFAFAAIVF